MTVKEVVLAAARLLGFDREVEEYVHDNINTGKEKSNDLVTCFNLVEGELALDYLPLFSKEELSVLDGRIAYEAFSKNPLRVISVFDETGCALPFEVFPTEIRLDKHKGKAVVEYAFLPEAKGLEDESDYQSGVSVGLAAYGVAAEYCATQGLYVESAFWNKKYKESIAKAYKVKRGGRMQSRKWV